jgi:hypothetical protein
MSTTERDVCRVGCAQARLENLFPPFSYPQLASRRPGSGSRGVNDHKGVCRYRSARTTEHFRIALIQELSSRLCGPASQAQRLLLDSSPDPEIACENFPIRNVTEMFPRSSRLCSEGQSARRTLKEISLRLAHNSASGRRARRARLGRRNT